MILAVVVAATAIGVAVQRVTGMGLALVAVPLFALVLGPLDAIRVCLLVGLPAYALSALRARRAIRWRSVIPLALPAVALTPLFALLARQAPERPLLLAAGVCCLLAVAVMARGATLPWLSGPAGAAGAGVVSAAMAALSGIAGPPAAMYGVNAGWSGEETRGTLSVYFFLLAVAAVPSLGLPQLTAEMWIAATSGGLAGVAAGRLLAGRFADRLVRQIVLTCAAIGALSMVVQAI